MRNGSVALPIAIGQERPYATTSQISGQRTFERPLVTARIVSRPHSHSIGKLQLPLNRLETRLVAQGIKERVGLHRHHARVR